MHNNGVREFVTANQGVTCAFTGLSGLMSSSDGILQAQRYFPSTSDSLLLKWQWQIAGREPAIMFSELKARGPVRALGKPAPF